MSDLRRIVTPGAERTRYLVRGPIAPRFVEARALSPGEAIAFAPADPRERRLLAAMLQDGSIRMAAPARFYFDMDAYEAAAAARARMLLPVWIAGALAIAVVAVLFYTG